jgi:polyhydroxybutyrate depolymerase
VHILGLLALALLTAEPLGPGDHFRSVKVDGQERSYHLHIPPQYDANKPTPVILAFHGGGTNAPIMALSCGLTTKADDAGFIVVYPNGTGEGNLMLVWNSGGFRDPNARNRPDDVAFVEALLNDLATVANVDSKRVYATGMSNGGMMCYRLAAELSDRIAAIAPVSGTMSVNRCRPKRPVAVIHFHGTADKRVPFDGPDERTGRFLSFKSVKETIRFWARLDGCPRKPEITDLPDSADDGTTVKRTVYGPGKEGVEVIHYTIEGGGHTWPGRQWPVPWLGNTSRDISATDLIWEFFQKHPMK